MNEKIYVKMEASSFLWFGKDGRHVKELMMSDSDVNKYVVVEITVDKVKNMEGKGQYFYVHVTKEKLPDGCENEQPIIKYNDGHFGGSEDVMFNNPLIEKRVAAGDSNEIALYWAVIKPAIINLLKN